jgi:hypothetical protein
MNETVFCEQCGAATEASASFCASCGSAQIPIAASHGPASSIVDRRDVPDEVSAGVGHRDVPDEVSADVDRPDAPNEPSAGASAAASVPTPPQPVAVESADGFGSSPALHSAPPPPPQPSPAGKSAGAPQGRLNRALGQARKQGDSQIVASFWLGWASVGSALIGLLAKSSALYFIGIVTGIVAIVTARFARQRAQGAGDVDLVYLSRYGQITGWIVVGLFIAVVLLFAAFFGSFLGSLGI